MVAWYTFKKHLGLTLVVAALALLAALPSAAANELSASLDRNQATLGDTLTLRVRFMGQRVQQDPDFSALEDDFEILGTQRSNQMRIINNQTESWTEWRLTLAPKRAGELQIPAVEFGGQRSEPLTLTVREPSSGRDGAARDDIWVEVSLSKDNPHVQEQVLMTVRLFTSVDLQAVELQPLELEDALVVEVAENRYRRQIDGVNHGIIENTFALFPQRSGELRIPALAYSVSLGSSRRDLWGNLHGTGRSGLRRLRTESKMLEVQPIPGEARGERWMPARDVELSERWSRDPDSLQVGEPVTRSITINADGLSGAQITPLGEARIDGFSYYPDQPQTDEQRDASGVRGTRMETVAMVPRRAGRHTLPEVTLRWWNTESQRFETATLPERRVRVQAAPGSIEDDRQAVEQPGASLADTGASLYRDTPSQDEPRVVTFVAWWWIAGAVFFALLSALLALMLWLSRRQLYRLTHTENAPVLDRNEAILWRQMKRSSADNDLNALRQQLIRWAQRHWQTDSLHRLDQIIARTDNETLHRLLRQLDQILFSGSTATDFDSGALLQEVAALRREKRDRHYGKNKAPLPPLYPEETHADT
ncbi:BatD family protein [Marinimicrobium alkaliphilum]|uniref:BatD family protein n=1 Tax=Marinimicrobium alkaliphilum TaxID=2202654 RepID=UPI000DB9FA64|nr:BatD family protein [Marinimicrobium alkaliphilum]